MTIRFEKATMLKLLFEQVYCAATTEALSAHSCVLLEQVEHNLTVATTKEPNKAIVQRYHVHQDSDAGGEPGIVYLIDQTELKSKLGKLHKAGVGSLTLRVNRGTLNLLVDYAVTQTGEKERGRLAVRQYGGTLSDFGEVFEASNLIGKVLAKDFSNWVSLLQKFADFNEKPGSDIVGRTVFLDIQPDKILGVANHKASYMCYLGVTIPGSELVENKFAVEGRHMKRLIKLSLEAPVEIYLDQIDGEDWVTFQGDRGRVSLKCVDPEDRTLMNYALFGNDPRVKEESNRLVALQDLLTSVTLQLPDETELQQELVLVEQKPHLVILQASDVKGKERAFVHIDPSVISEEWAPVLINAQAFVSILRSFQSYFKFTNLASSALVLTQKSTQRASGNKSWLLAMQSFEEADALQLQSFVVVRHAEKVSDQLDVAE
ncbi:hypothetical protein OsccyDRAFT_0736 [Leptolyngbyaceae cyanobacterium JSC-12]|nr:hypothetical protein OsccyDRAFT_0736 [Leptolyngbyaceae cyanobacterium JSC-12]